MPLLFEIIIILVGETMQEPPLAKGMHQNHAKNGNSWLTSTKTPVSNKRQKPFKGVYYK